MNSRVTKEKCDHRGLLINTTESKLCFNFHNVAIGLTIFFDAANMLVYVYYAAICLIVCDAAIGFSSSLNTRVGFTFLIKRYPFN